MAAGVTEAFNDVVVRIIDTPSLWRGEKYKSSPRNAFGAASGSANTIYQIARRLEHAGEYRSVPDAGRGHVCWVFVLAVRSFFLSSPLWWYVIPTANDPMYSDLNKKEQYPNYTTTFGNNVRTSIIIFLRMVLITGACSYGPVYFNVTEGILVFSYDLNNVSGNF